MKKCLVFLIILFSIEAYNQELEFNIGVNRIGLYDNNDSSNPHLASNYKNEKGIHFGVGYYDVIKNNKSELPKNFYLTYDRYEGEFYLRSGGLGSTNAVRANYKRETIGITYFALNFSLVKEYLTINFGPNFSFVANSKMSGTKTFSNIIGDNEITNLDKNDIEEITVKSHFGLIGRIQSRINLTSRIALSPKYDFQYGLTNEFNTSYAKTKRFIQNYSIGLIWRLDKNK